MSTQRDPYARLHRGARQGAVVAILAILAFAATMASRGEILVWKTTLSGFGVLLLVNMVTIVGVTGGLLWIMTQVAKALGYKL